ncbi:MAG TPA: DUF488 domain-containing protein [Actinomycetota bacterium]|nr:DUF488 domain-containing protein [Actinomycetota bacterium]
MTALYTVGHSTHGIDAFIDLVRQAGLRHVVDVRVVPASRRHPHFARDALERALASAGLGYTWEGEALGGFRKAPPGSRHTALRNDSFRGYAEHMGTVAFRSALGRVLERAAEEPTTVMCAEAVWWRCHRGLIADAVVAQGHAARHLMPDGSIRAHALRDIVRVEDGWPVYDVVPIQPAFEDLQGHTP